MSIRKFAIVMMLLQALSLTILSTGYSVVTLCIGLAMFGASVGNLLMLQPLLIAEAFGVKSYSRIFFSKQLDVLLRNSDGPGVTWSNLRCKFKFVSVTLCNCGRVWCLRFESIHIWRQDYQTIIQSLIFRSST